MNEFDSKAREWDMNPVHIERAKAIATELMKMIPVTYSMKALEYGAGTGLLSFLLKEMFTEITLMDSSQEMIRVAQEKIVAGNIGNLNTALIDLEKNEFVGEFDIIYSQMVLHHVGNIELIFDKFYALLKHRGYLAIADLYTEDGSFHGEGFTGHKGFDVDHLRNLLTRKGFKDIKNRQCYIQKKEVEPEIEKEFPVFLLVASK